MRAVNSFTQNNFSENETFNNENIEQESVKKKYFSMVLGWDFFCYWQKQRGFGLFFDNRNNNTNFILHDCWRCSFFLGNKQSINQKKGENFKSKK